MIQVDKNVNDYKCKITVLIIFDIILGEINKKTIDKTNYKAQLENRNNQFNQVMKTEHVKEEDKAIKLKYIVIFLF